MTFRLDLGARGSINGGLTRPPKIAKSDRKRPQEYHSGECILISIHSPEGLPARLKLTQKLVAPVEAGGAKASVNRKLITNDRNPWCRPKRALGRTGILYRNGFKF